MSQSNTPEDDDWPDFDAKQFARQTIFTIEYGDACASLLERRVIRVEECIAARWPRRWLLWARLRREIRATTVTWDPEYIPRGDFRTRRSEWAGHEADAMFGTQRATRRLRQAEDDAEAGNGG